LRSEDQRGQNVKIVFRADLRQNESNDQRPILQISSNIFQQRKCFVFVIFVSNYPERPHIAAATWPCTYFFMSLAAYRPTEQQQHSPATTRPI